MDEKTAKKLVAALEDNTKALEEQNRITKLLAGKTSAQPRQAAPANVDPLTAHLNALGKG